MIPEFYEMWIFITDVTDGCSVINLELERLIFLNKHNTLTGW